MPGMSGMAMGKSDAPMAMPMHMPMKMDLNDVHYDAFLANDRTLADPQIVRVDRRGRVLLRIINGASSSAFRIDLGPVRATLVAVDGHRVQPVTGTSFPLAMAQRIDLALDLPAEHPVVPVFAVLEGERRRTGLILAADGASVTKLPDHADKSAPALDFALEQRLAAVTPLAAKRADRTHQVALTGSMAGYAWSLNGLAYGADKPLMVATGERVELVMTNRSMMAHPMHLHGHSFQVVALDGERFAGAVRGHRAGAADALGHGRLRCEQSRPLGLPLPQPLPHGGGHDDERAVRDLLTRRHRSGQKRRIRISARPVFLR